MPALCNALGLPSRVGRSSVQVWTPANLASPPHISIDADRVDLLTKDGSNVLTSLRTVHTNVAANTPALVTHAASFAAFNGFAAFQAPGQSAQQCNFSTNAGSLLNNKSGCTMIMLGRFAQAAPAAFNSAIINATTTSASSTRCSFATSSTVANCPRHVIRRLDADTANGDDIGTTNRGQAVFIAVLRQDNTGAVLGAGTPTKQTRFTQSAARDVATEATGLGSGNFSATNSAYIGFFNSGTVAQALVDMNYGAISDSVYTDAEVERIEGYLAWKIGMPQILPGDHPYRNSRP